MPFIAALQKLVMPMRENIVTSDEIKEIIKADIVLIIAFSLTLAGGLGELAANRTMFLNTIVMAAPIAALAVTLSFILHELMHKFVAQHYGAIAGFRSSTMGLAVTLITGAFGFLLGIPGATMIYVHSFTRKENGIVSLAGPLTNLAVFVVFLALLIGFSPSQGSYLYNAISFTIFISLLLAFFNMLPIAPLDGSKVLEWSFPVYVVTMGAILILIVTFGVLPWYDILYLVIIALIISSFTRRMF